MIVLDKYQRNTLLSFMGNYIDKMKDEGLIIDPVEIKSGEFILPEEVLNDERAADIKSFLLSNSTIREVQESELKIPPML